MTENLEPIRCWRATVPTDWIDYNNHLTEGYYGVAFGYSGDMLLEELGFDATYREAVSYTHLTLPTNREV